MSQRLVSSCNKSRSNPINGHETAADKEYLFEEDTINLYITHTYWNFYYNSKFNNLPFMFS